MTYLEDLYKELMKSVNFLLENRNVLMLVGLLILLFILMNFLNVSSSFQNALLDDKIVVKKKDAYLDEKVKYLSDNLNIPPMEPYTISKGLRKLLCKDRFGHTSIDALVHEILDTIGVPTDNLSVVVNIDKTSRFATEKGTAGKYVETTDGRQIHIQLKNSYSLNEVVAIICHECSHAFLNYHNVKLEDTKENEALTDTCAIYLGFAQYLLSGYKPVKQIASITYTSTSRSAKIQSSYIGYLNLSQLEYICKALRKIKKQNFKKQSKTNSYI